MSALNEFRANKDDFFREHPQSPLTPEQKSDFNGLAYFDENPDLRFEVELEKSPDEGVIQIQTSTGQLQSYRRYGKFNFMVDGQPGDLTIFESEQGFFLPFVDTLAGEASYPAGRYLEPEPLAGDRFLIDFNLAYNPYCAYNEKWSCPLTPAENRLKVAIRAGERLYPK